jgi:hypothetical protein
VALRLKPDIRRRAPFRVDHFKGADQNGYCESFNSSWCKAHFASNIQSRSTRFGQAIRAAARGVRMGCMPKSPPRLQRKAIKRRDAGDPVREIARTFNVSHSTTSRLSP